MLPEPAAATAMKRFAWERALRGVDMTPSTRAVLLAAATYADRDGGRIRPGTPRLAADCGVDVRSVTRALRWARDAGWLIQEARGHRRGDGSRASSTYRLSAPIAAAGALDQAVADALDAVESPVEDPISTGHPCPVDPDLNRTISSSLQDTRVHPSVLDQLKTPLPPASGGMDRRPHCPEHRRYRGDCSACRALISPRPARPVWCGSCDPETRLFWNGDTASRCRRCHPLTAPEGARTNDPRD